MQWKNRGGLCEASNDVITICKIAEKTFRLNQHILFKTKNILQRLILQTSQSLPSHVLYDNKHIFDQSPLFDHRDQVIKLILQKFFNLRLNHESKAFTNCNQRIRMKNNKLTLFQNQ